MWSRLIWTPFDQIKRSYLYSTPLLLWMQTDNFKNNVHLNFRYFQAQQGISEQISRNAAILWSVASTKTKCNHAAQKCRKAKTTGVIFLIREVNNRHSSYLDKTEFRQSLPQSNLKQQCVERMSITNFTELYTHLISWEGGIIIPHSMEGSRERINV